MWTLPNTILYFAFAIVFSLWGGIIIFVYRFNTTHETQLPYPWECNEEKWIDEERKILDEV